MNISTAVRVFGLKPKPLYYLYRNHLSDYVLDVEAVRRHPEHIEKMDVGTGELTNGKPLYVFKLESTRERMSMDDKSIGHEGFTILSNGETGRIAMMEESRKAMEVSDIIPLFSNDLRKVESISCDIAASYLQVCFKQFSEAKTVIDKFHVMRYMYDAVPE